MRELQQSASFDQLKKMCLDKMTEVDVSEISR